MSDAAMEKKNVILELEDKLYRGSLLSKEDALKLTDADHKNLGTAADRIRRHFCGNVFDLCTIISGKSGRCPEDCKYCAQSMHYSTYIDEAPLLGSETILDAAKQNAAQGIHRFSIVTSGKRLSDKEIDSLCDSVSAIRKATPLKVCVSAGLLTPQQYEKLRDVGVVRIHNNLETSKEFFPSICTTHTIEDKIAAIKAAKDAGLQVCSGGIIGLGESMTDRIDLALLLRELNIRSIPINILNPIPGTPLERQPSLPYEEIVKTIAIFRFLLPDVFLRLAGGRGLMPDGGRACFLSGANAAISGDMLTTSGITVETDITMITNCGFDI